MADQSLTLYEFLKLDVNARGTYLWEHGTFITNSADEIGLSAFYQLHDFYVDVMFDLEFNTIISVTPFKEGERYERMVDTIRLP